MEEKILKRNIKTKMQRFRKSRQRSKSLKTNAKRYSALPQRLFGRSEPQVIVLPANTVGEATPSELMVELTAKILNI